MESDKNKSSQEKIHPNVQKVLDRIESLEKKFLTHGTSTSTPPVTPLKTEEKHEHWKAEDIGKSECPTCKAEIEKIKALGRGELIEALKKRGSLDSECKDCGTGVEKTEERCPTCGGTNARKRE